MTNETIGSREKTYLVVGPESRGRGSETVGLDLAGDTEYVGDIAHGERRIHRTHIEKLELMRRVSEHGVLDEDLS